MALEHVSYLETKKKTEWLDHKLFFSVPLEMQSKCG